MLKVSCPQQALLESVQVVSRGVSGRSTQPVQNNILLEAKGKTLRLLATDLEYLSLEAVIEAEVQEEGATTVPARLLAEVINALPNDAVNLLASDTHGVNISCGRSKYDIRGLSAADFSTLPELNDPIRFEMSQGALLKVLNRTVFATSRDETRPILTGALFNISSGSLEVVSTDTYRLALQTTPLEVELPDTRGAIVSRRVLSEVMRILQHDNQEPVAFAISGNQIEIKVGNLTIGSRLIEGQFVNYGKVIPTAYERRLTVNLKEMNAALHRALIVAREDANRVVLRSEGGNLLLTANSQDVGNLEESLPVQLEGEDAEIAFNARYLLDMLDAVDAEAICMELSGPLNSGIIKPAGEEGYLYVLMPMQIM
jgi:DNA polymerase III subunit beta